MAVLRTVGILAVVALLCAYIYSTLKGPQGLSALAAKREEIRALQEENANLKQDVEAKAERIRQLKESQSEQELEIRKRMKLVKPGETVFIITDKPVPKAPPAPPKPAQAEVVPPKPAANLVSPDDVALPPKQPAAKKSAKAKSDEDAEKKAADGAKPEEPSAPVPPPVNPPSDPPKDPPPNQ